MCWRQIDWGSRYVQISEEKGQQRGGGRGALERTREKLDWLFGRVSLKWRGCSRVDCLSDTHIHTHTSNPTHNLSPPSLLQWPCRCARAGDYRRSPPIMGWLFRRALIDWGDMQMAVIWDDKGCGCWMPPALFSLGCTQREGCGVRFNCWGERG